MTGSSRNRASVSRPARQAISRQPSRAVTAGLLLLAVWLSPVATADGMAMRDYHLLDNDMSQAEVLQRVGPPDRESVFGDGVFGPTRIIWYYIPSARDGWITEIIFDAQGRIRDTKRYKP